MDDLDHCDWKLALQELFRGQDAAVDLQTSLFRAPEHEDRLLTVTHDDLARAITGSFAKALSLLGYCNTTEPDGAASSCFSSTDSEPVVGGKIDGRGRYKRWKSCDSWSKTTPALVDDGHAWRKYGQKMIHGSDFPRSYFRCTHKSDQHCQAMKQVQQISQDPPVHQTTYYGHHTCKNTFNPEQFIVPEEETTFKLVSFDGNVPRNTMN